jgi:hypothetical protein
MIPILKPGKFSQCWQDVFAFNICGNAGTYIEIGASTPIKNSNTYTLETYANYKGFSLELDKSRCYDLWIASERKNKVYWDNALTFDYTSATIENNLSKHINYLSCDIDPPENTFNALKRIIDQDFKFDVITFEHDNYNSSIDYDSLSMKFLLDRGYNVAVTGVYYKNPNFKFETWYVNSNIPFEEQPFDQWKTNNIRY